MSPELAYLVVIGSIKGSPLSAIAAGPSPTPPCCAAWTSATCADGASTPGPARAHHRRRALGSHQGDTVTVACSGGRGRGPTTRRWGPWRDAPEWHPPTRSGEPGAAAGATGTGGAGPRLLQRTRPRPHQRPGATPAATAAGSAPATAGGDPGHPRMARQEPGRRRRRGGGLDAGPAHHARPPGASSLPAAAAGRGRPDEVFGKAKL
jgi:hypothetical protein